jgi:hypothetical protein
VNCIEVEVSGLPKWLTTFSFGDCRKRSKEWGKLAAIYSITVAADLKGVLVIPEFAVIYNLVEERIGCWWHILPPLLISYSEKENRQAQGRNYKSKWI